MDSASKIYRPSPLDLSDGLQQGEIISGLIQIHLEVAVLAEGNARISQRQHPYAVVLSQGCDLEQDFKKRTSKNPSPTLPNILFCETVTAEVLNSKISDYKMWANISKNKNERDQFLQKIDPELDAQGEGLPELGLDFKRYFTIPTDEVYYRLEIKQMKRRSVLSSPYLEHLCSRFGYYLGRVGLDWDHLSDDD